MRYSDREYMSIDVDSNERPNIWMTIIRGILVSICLTYCQSIVSFGSTDGTMNATNNAILAKVCLRFHYFHYWSHSLRICILCEHKRYSNDTHNEWMRETLLIIHSRSDVPFGAVPVLCQWCAILYSMLWCSLLSYHNCRLTAEVSLVWQQLYKVVFTQSSLHSLLCSSLMNC